MKRKNMTRNALFTSIISLLLCVSMLVGTTFAWFTDTVESGRNVIAAGNLDVELYHTDKNAAEQKVDGSTKLFDDVDPNLWEPGAVAYETLQVKNVGTLALKYQLNLTVLNETVVNGNKLSDVIMVGTKVDGFTSTTREGVIGEISTWSKLSEFKFDSSTKTLAAGKDAQKIGIALYWRPNSNEVDNLYNLNNGQSGTLQLDIGVNLYATQVEVETDSFGPTYDENAWGDGFDVHTEQDLNAAIADGETNIDVMDDIQLTGSIEIPASAATYDLRSTPNAVRINLNGYTITGSMHKNDGPVIKNEGNLILENGTVSSIGNNGGSALINNGTAVLKNVTMNGAPNADGSWPSYTVNNTGDLTATEVRFTSYHGAVASYGEGALVTLNNCEIDMAGIPGFTSHGIYTYDNGAVVVNGGEYANKATDQAASGASVINGAVTINGGTFSGRIENYYGTPVIKGGTFSVKPNANFIAGGYEANDNGNGTYTVGFPQESFDTLINNAQPGDTVNVPAGTYTFPASDLKEGMTLECAPGTVFEGSSSLNINGATVIGATFDAGEGNVAGTGAINGTFKDCTFTGSEALRWCYTTEGTTTVFEGCVIETDFRGVHFDGMNGDVIFRNCEINGFNAIGGTGTVTFENCTFGYDNSSYNGLNMYVDTTLTNCEFAFVSGKTNFIDFEAAGKTLKITNCTATLDGAPADVVDFVGGTYKNETNIVELMPSEDGIILAKNGNTDVVSLYNVADFEDEVMVVPAEVTAMGNSVFGYTNIKTVEIPASVTEFGASGVSDTNASGGAFKNSNVETIILSEGMTEIPAAAFNGATKLTSVNIPSTVKKIGVNAFRSTAITELVIPATVEDIAYGAFRDMTSLKKVTFEGEKLTLPGYAFRGCTNLREVHLKAETVALNGSMNFANASSNNPNTNNITFYCENETVANAVKTHMGVGSYVAIYVGDNLYAEIK